MRQSALLACVSAGAGVAVAPRSVLDTVRSRGQFHTDRLPKKLRRISTLRFWRQDFRSAKLDALKDLPPAL